MAKKNLFTKRFFSIILTLAVALSMMLVTVWGGETDPVANANSVAGSTAQTTNSVAKVTIGGGTTYYENILDAFAAADVDGQTATVTLLQNTEIPDKGGNYGIELENGSSISFDLNGKELKHRDGIGQAGFYTRSAVLYVSGGTCLTIEDKAGGGKIVQPNGGPAVRVDQWSSGEQPGKIIVNGGTIENTANEDYGNGNWNCAIYAAGNGIAEVQGGTLIGKRGAYVQNGTLTVTETSDSVPIFKGSETGLYFQLGTVALSGGIYTSTDENGCGIETADSQATSLLAGGYRYTDAAGKAITSIEGNDKKMPKDTYVKEIPEGEASYIDADGNWQTQTGCIDITESTTELTGNWYVVRQDVSIASLKTTAETNVILCDGANLNLTGTLDISTAKLNIYLQTNGTGKITANGGINKTANIDRSIAYLKMVNSSGQNVATAENTTESATISKCDHPEKTYTSKDAQNHEATCNFCDMKTEEKHSFDSWTSEDENKHKHVCNKCDCSVEEAHKIGNATPNADGLTHSGKCTECDYAMTSANHNYQTESGTCTCGARIAATYNNTDYANLQSAVNAAGQSEGTVQVKEHEVTQCITIENNQKLTLDLNGKTLDSTYHPLEVPGILMINGGQLTLKNGTVYGSSDTNARPAVILKGGSLILDKNVIIEGGNTNKGNVKYPAIKITSAEASLTLNEGNKLVNGMEVPEGKVLADYLTEGMAFATGGNVINGYIQSTTKDLIVVTHTHELTNNECACGYTVIAKIGDKKYTSLQEAVNKVTNDSTIELVHDTTEEIIVSSALKLKGNGHTIGKLTVSGNITLKDLLAEGYAYKNGDNWLSDSDLNGKTELTNVTIAEIPIKSVTAENNGAVTATYGTQITLKATVIMADGTSAYTSEWSKVDGNNEIELTSNGGYAISDNTCKLPSDLAAGSYGYRLTCTKDGYSKSCEFTVTVEQKALTPEMAESIDDQTYDGNAKTPEVTLNNGAITLVKDTDYTVVYKDNTNAGTATVTITSQGNYTGTVTKKFTIQPKNLSANEITVADGGTYDGNAKTPNVTVKDGDKTLTQGTEYTLLYENNTNAGENTAKVTITGKGNYTGMVEKNFSIAKANYTGDKATNYHAYTDGSHFHVPLFNFLAYGSTPDTDSITINKATKAGEKDVDLINKDTITWTDDPYLDFDTNECPAGYKATMIIKVFGRTNYYDYEITVNITVREKNPATVTITGDVPGSMEYGDSFTLTASQEDDKYYYQDAKWNWEFDATAFKKIKEETTIEKLDGTEKVKKVTNTITLKAIKVGPVTDTITANYVSSEYKGSSSKPTTTVNINKADAKVSAPDTKVTIYKKLEKTYHFNIGTLELPEDCGNVSYNLFVDMVFYYDHESGAEYNHETGVLTLPIVDATTTHEEAGTVIITVVTDNYEDIIWTINVNAEYKIVPEGAPTLSKEKITYGEKLNTITLSGSMKDGDKDIEGSFTWEDGTIEPDSGNRQYIWIFTPSEDNYQYETARGMAEITVEKAELADVSVSQTGSLTYTGTPQNADVTASATAKKNQKVTFTYSDSENGTYSDTVPAFTNAGVHTVYYKAEAANHETATGSFGVTIAAKELTIQEVKIKNKVYDGKDTAEIETVTFDGLVGTDTVEYTALDVKFNSADVKDANEVTGTITLNKDVKNYVLPDANFEVSATIAKAVATCTAEPTVETLTYNGGYRPLVKTGTADGGKLVYSTEENGTYDEKIPTGKDVGTYTVWYKVAGDDNHNDTAPGKLEVIIQAKTVTATVTVEGEGFTYNGKAHTPKVTVKDGDTVVDEKEYTVSYENNTSAGDARVTVTDKDGGNYKVSGSTTFTIAQAAVTTTDKPTQDIIYAGTEVSKATFKENTVTVDFNGTTTLEGTWTIVAKDGAEKFNRAGKYTCTATFTPDDKNFAPITGIEVTVRVTNRWSGSTPTEVITTGKIGEKVTSSPAEVKNETKTDEEGKQVTTAKVTVSEANRKEILKQAKDNKSGEIVIKVSEKEVAENAKLEISLDKGFIDSIVKDTDAKLTIKTPAGDKTFTQEELKKLSESAAADGTIAIDASVFEEPTEPAEPSGTLTSAQEKIVKGVKATTITLKSVRTKSGKIRLTWSKSKGYKVDYFEVYRSVKKNSGYGKKPFFTTKSGDISKYLNTKNLKKGKTYYYKVRGVRVINGKKYYTGYSNKTWKTMK